MNSTDTREAVREIAEAALLFGVVAAAALVFVPIAGVKLAAEGRVRTALWWLVRGWSHPA
ncbi:hypothetical protein [Haladaptatus salinisoli]|uniref:hypothetical protein n=1 Tax=Haladaptatus salinisoli TaxID=2884876 RepID=UPI001D0A687F|nr:hypothetical protein [Haladaptatus salinisoli]